MKRKQELLQALTDINAIQFGEFTLRSGKTSSVYVDLRAMIAYPTLLRQVANLLWDKVKDRQPALLCGVPYTALPIATCISLDQNLPMVMCRKEAKQYGTKKHLEGVFDKGQNCLIVEDVVTTAGSVINTINILRQHELHVTDVVVVVDRREGGQENLEQQGYRLHSVFTLSELYQN